MRDHRMPRELQGLLQSFQSCFSSRSASNFVALVLGWILCGGRRTISRVCSASGALSGRHFSCFYRFFSRAIWSHDDVSRVLVGLLLKHIPDDVHVAVDDTLCRRTGPHFFGAAMHHDGAASSRSSSTGRRPVFAFGHNWVVLSVAIRLPWGQERWLAVPAMLRLYRAKSRCPASQYQKRTELARELLLQMRTAIPAERRLLVAGDSEYACSTVLKELPEGIEFVGPMMMKAALYGQPKVRKGRGRPRLYGEREPSPAERLGRSGGRWRRVQVRMYGRDVTLLIKTAVTRWRKVTGTKPVLLVLTRDPKGNFQDRAFFSTDLTASPAEVLARMARRWSIEVCFRDLKQLFGFGDAQNGWGKKQKSGRRRRKAPGPQPRGRKGELAIERTAPFAALVYALVVLWYLERDRAEEDVEAARQSAPWYTQKEAPSVQDMVIALRGELLARRISDRPTSYGARARILRAIPRALLAA